jgi:hypothetical protein
MATYSTAPPPRPAPDSIMRINALPPPPPTPTTLIVHGGVKILLLLTVAAAVLAALGLVTVDNVAGPVGIEVEEPLDASKCL